MTRTNRLARLRPEGAYAVMARAHALEEMGREIIHLEIGQPDFETFSHISQEGIRAIQAGYTRYNPPAGLLDFRKVIAEDAGERRGIEIDPQQVVIAPGAKPGLFFSTLALVEPGDEVLYPDPGFPTYPAMIEVAGGLPVPVPLHEKNNFSFDMSAFEDLISERTRLIILNSPANPTGGVISRHDLEYIAHVADQHQIWVLSDEIYACLVYEDQSAPSIAALPGMAERTVIVDGFSKTYAMTGWRLGYAIMPIELAEQVELLLTHSIGCTATFTQIAGLKALTATQDPVTAMVAEYQHRRDQIVDGLNNLKGVHCQVPQGAFYVFPNVKSIGMPVRELAHRLLEQAGVAVLPGTDFGSNGEGYLRLCYATSPANIDRAIRRMATFLS
jgi:aspartate aminotransferase